MDDERTGELLGAVGGYRLVGANVNEEAITLLMEADNGDRRFVELTGVPCHGGLAEIDFEILEVG